MTTWSQSLAVHLEVLQTLKFTFAVAGLVDVLCLDTFDLRAGGFVQGFISEAHIDELGVAAATG